MSLTLYQILCLLGVPSLASVLGWLYKAHKKRREEEKKKEHIFRLALQALLRGRMIDDYNRWNEKGYAPIYAKENFENCWTQYHALGVNGVMDDMYEKFMNLPTKK